MKRNIDRLSRHAASLGVALRPHLKTTKSVEAARLVLANENGPATVSTLAEAEVFARAGITDILYAVGISPDKLDRVVALHRQGCKLIVLLDCAAQAEAIAAASEASGIAIPAMIEIDSDGHRSGLTADDPALIEEGGSCTKAAQSCAAFCAMQAKAMPLLVGRSRRNARKRNGLPWSMLRPCCENLVCPVP